MSAHIYTSNTEALTVAQTGTTGAILKASFKPARLKEHNAANLVVTLTTESAVRGDEVIRNSQVISKAAAQGSNSAHERAVNKAGWKTQFVLSLDDVTMDADGNVVVDSSNQVFTANSERVEFLIDFNEIYSSGSSSGRADDKTLLEQFTGATDPRKLDDTIINVTLAGWEGVPNTTSFKQAKIGDDAIVFTSKCKILFINELVSATINSATWERCPPTDDPLRAGGNQDIRRITIEATHDNPQYASVRAYTRTEGQSLEEYEKTLVQINSVGDVGKGGFSMGATAGGNLSAMMYAVEVRLEGTTITAVLEAATITNDGAELGVFSAKHLNEYSMQVAGTVANGNRRGDNIPRILNQGWTNQVASLNTTQPRRPTLIDIAGNRETAAGPPESSYVWSLDSAGNKMLPGYQSSGNFQQVTLVPNGASGDTATVEIQAIYFLSTDQDVAALNQEGTETLSMRSGVLENGRFVSSLMNEDVVLTEQDLLIQKGETRMKDLAANNDNRIVLLRAQVKKEHFYRAGALQLTRDFGVCVIKKGGAYGYDTEANGMDDRAVEQEGDITSVTVRNPHHISVVSLDSTARPPLIDFTTGNQTHHVKLENITVDKYYALFWSGTRRAGGTTPTNPVNPLTLVAYDTDHPYDDADKLNINQTDGQGVEYGANTEWAAIFAEALPGTGATNRNNFRPGITVSGWDLLNNAANLSASLYRQAAIVSQPGTPGNPVNSGEVIVSFDVEWSDKYNGNAADNGGLDSRKLKLALLETDVNNSGFIIRTTNASNNHFDVYFTKNPDHKDAKTQLNDRNATQVLPQFQKTGEVQPWQFLHASTRISAFQGTGTTESLIRTAPFYLTNGPPETDRGPTDEFTMEITPNQAGGSTPDLVCGLLTAEIVYELTPNYKDLNEAGYEVGENQTNSVRDSFESQNAADLGTSRAQVTYDGATVINTGDVTFSMTMQSVPGKQYVKYFASPVITKMEVDMSSTNTPYLEAIYICGSTRGCDLGHSSGSRPFTLMGFSGLQQLASVDFDRSVPVEQSNRYHQNARIEFNTETASFNDNPNFTAKPLVTSPESGNNNLVAHGDDWTGLSGTMQPDYTFCCKLVVNNAAGVMITAMGSKAEGGGVSTEVDENGVVRASDNAAVLGSRLLALIFMTSINAMSAAVVAMVDPPVSYAMSHRLQTNAELITAAANDTDDETGGRGRLLDNAVLVHPNNSAARNVRVIQAADLSPDP